MKDPPLADPPPDPGSTDAAGDDYVVKVEAAAAAAAAAAVSATSTSAGNASDSDWSDIATDDDDEHGLKIDLGVDDDILESESLAVAAVDAGSSPQPDLPAIRQPSSGSSNSISGTKKKKIDGSPAKGPRRLGLKKAVVRKRRNVSGVDVPTEVLDAIARARGANFNRRLDKAAKKMRLNRTQVKSVLRRLVESPEFVDLVLEKAGDKPSPGGAGGQWEPRITRTLARTVVDNGGKLNWFLEKVAHTPKKVTPESLALMQEEFPEDEDDQEYDPSKDPEVEGKASDDEDSLATASDTGTPGGSASLGVQTPPSAQSQHSDVSRQTPATVSLDPDLGTFKHPAVTKRVQDLGGVSGGRMAAGASPSVVRALDFDGLAPSTSKNFEWGGASPLQPSRNTRSKASLKEVTIEELETQFQPPDVTPDMYDAIPTEDFDDYALFLAETFGQPVSNKPEEEVEETVTDPDFVYQDDNEEAVDSGDEFKNNRSTKIPQKEVDALMQELFDAYELGRVEEEHELALQNQDPAENASEMVADQQFQPAEPVCNMTDDQKELLAQQMRQHIQLLTQMSLLTAKEEYWSILNKECGEMLSDLVSKSLQCPYSMFAQDNLFPSLSAVDLWKNSPGAPSAIPKGKGKPGVKVEMSKELMGFMRDRPIFVYPQLLPACALNPEPDKNAFWSIGEDQLLTILMEEHVQNNTGSMNMSHIFRQASEGYLRTKTSSQIRFRFKNQSKRIDKDQVESNPILYFKKFKKSLKLPNFSNLFPYSSAKVVSPKMAPPALLPAAWREYLNNIRSETEVTSRIEDFLPTAQTRHQLIQHIEITQQPIGNIAVELPASSSGQVILSMPSFSSPIKSEAAPNIIVVQAQPEMPLVAMPTVEEKPQVPRFRPIRMKGAEEGVPPPSKYHLKTIKPRSKKPKVPVEIKKEIKAKEPVSDVTSGIVLLPNKGDASTTTSCSKTSQDLNSNADAMQPPNVVSMTILDTAMEECGIGSEPMSVQSEPASQQLSNDASELVDNSKTASEETVDKKPDLEPRKTDPVMVPEQQQQGMVLKEEPNSQGRKTKSQRDAEVVLATLQPEPPSEKVIRQEHEAVEMIMYAKEILSEKNLRKFFLTVAKHEKEPTKAFTELHPICEGFPLLQEMLLDLLDPEQALSLGHPVYAQYCQRMNLKRLMQKLRIMFPNQSSHAKVLKELETLLNKPDLTPEEWKAFGSKYFKSNQQLHDEFVSLMMKEPFPESLLPGSPERIVLDDDDEDDNNEGPDYSDYEHVDLPDTDDEKKYGTENCPCSCHCGPVVNHCLHCSIRFINGKIYVKDGKILKPVKVEYPKGLNPFEKTSRNDRPKRKRQKSTNIT